MPETDLLKRAASTAMQRVEMSRPLRLALEHGVIRESDDVFDYGCGYGDDIAFLTELGYVADGWDPAHRPHTGRATAAVVILGYVLNVIEDPAERSLALREAWRLAQRAVVVAVRTTHEAASISDATPHADGCLTGSGTFQKLFGQAEARAYIDTVFEAQSVPLGLGVFVAFKDEAAEQEWLEHRNRIRVRVRRLRRIVEPKKTKRDLAYENHRDVLRALEEFLAEHGRLPVDEEADWLSPINQALGSVAKAFQVVRHVADDPWWDAASDDRRGELRIRFALARLRRRPKYSALPITVQRDVRALFGSYKTACEHADELLFSIGDASAIRAAAREAEIGKLTPDAFYVHIDALPILPPLLRVFVGAAEALSGPVPSANLIKIHFDHPRVSYLVYPDFDADPHPTLAESWVVDFRELDVRPTDYRTRDNPPVLHRKELFVAPEHPRYDTFRRLTEQEDRHGLLDETSRIGTRSGWEQHLEASGWKLTGHRLVRAARE